MGNTHNKFDSLDTAELKIGGVDKTAILNSTVNDSLLLHKAGAETIAGLKKFEVGGDNDDINIGAIMGIYSTAGSTNTLINCYAVAGVLKYKTTNPAYLIQTNTASGTYRIFQAPSGTIDTNVTFSPVFIINNTGNIGIGSMTTPSEKLDVEGNIKGQTIKATTSGNALAIEAGLYMAFGSNSPSVAYNAYLDSGSWKYKSTGRAMLVQWTLSTGTYVIYSAPSGTIDTAITWTAVQDVQPNGDFTSAGFVKGATLQSLGLVDISGASAGQIKFPATQNPSSDANTLDDYKEGSFTGGCAFSGVSTGVTFSTNTCTFLKIGKRVFFEMQLSFSSIGGLTGDVRFTGLPYTASNAGVCEIGYSDTIPFTGVPRAYVANGGTTIVFDQALIAGSQPHMTEANMANNSQIILSGNYLTAN